MVYLNLQIQSIAQGLIDAGYNLSLVAPEAVVAFSATAPASPASGQMWLSSVTNVLSIWNGTAWQAVGLSAAEKAILTDLTTGYYTSTQIDNALALKQNVLSSGLTLKTVNGNDLLGSGNVVIGATVNSIDDIGNVTLGTVANGDVLSFNGTAWVNSSSVGGLGELEGGSASTVYSVADIDLESGGAV